MLKRLLLLIVFLKSFGAFSQKSIIVEKKGLGSVNDTVVIEIDTANKKVVLLSSKPKFNYNYTIRKVKLKSDLVWSISKKDNNAVLAKLNQFAISEDKIDSADFANFLSLNLQYLESKSGMFRKFNLNGGRIVGSSHLSLKWSKGT